MGSTAMRPMSRSRIPTPADERWILADELRTDSLFRRSRGRRANPNHTFPPPALRSHRSKMAGLLSGLLRSPGFAAAVIPLSAAVAGAGGEVNPSGELMPRLLYHPYSSGIKRCFSTSSRSSGSEAAGIKRCFSTSSRSSGSQEEGKMSPGGGGGELPGGPGKEKFCVPCLNFDGVVVCCGESSMFCGGLSCAVRGDPWVEQVKTDELKRKLMRLQFGLQQEVYKWSLKDADLKNRDKEAKAREDLNACTSANLKKDLADLLESSRAFERRSAEEKKTDLVLVKISELLDAMEGLKSSIGLGQTAQKAKDGVDPPPVNEKQVAPPSKKLSCRAYVYVKNMFVEGLAGKGPVGHVIYCLRKADGCYSYSRKYYPIVVGGIAWYTSGITTFGELVDLIEKKHIDNAKKYKKEVADYRDTKKLALEKEEKEKDKEEKELEEAAASAAGEQTKSTPASEDETKSTADKAAPPAAEEEAKTADEVKAKVKSWWRP